MRPRLIYFRAFRNILAAAFALAAGLMVAGAADGPSLRVTTWSLQLRTVAETNISARDPEAARIQAAAVGLKKLDADVIILRDVADWQSCNALIEALRPANYNLAVCSSFRDPRTGALSRRQAAILSRTRASISWSESWKSQGNAAGMPGGFAFAAIRIGNRNAGFFSVEFGDTAPGQADATQQQSRDESVRQLLQQVAALRRWTANRVESVVVAGDFGVTMDDAPSADLQTFRLLDDAGLVNAFANVPRDHRITFPGLGQRADATRDYIFAKNAELVGVPMISPTAGTEHYPVTCEFNLTTPKPTPVIAPVVHVELPPERTPVVAAAQTDRAPAPPVIVQQAVLQPARPINTGWLAGSIAGGLVVLFLFWRLMRRTRRQPAAGNSLAMKSQSATSISLPSDGERIVITHRSGEAPRHEPIIRIETAGSSQTQAHAWQRRAEDAERRADRATSVLRAGLLPHLSRWLKETLVRKLVSDRQQLLETQRAAALKLLAVDDRLSKIESQLQRRDQNYERRIDELMKELAVAKEENRELIRARIALVKAEMERERTRTAAQLPGLGEDG